MIVSVSFHGVTVHTERNDICNRAACPIAPGEFVLKNSEVLPVVTPPVGIRVFYCSKVVLLSLVPFFFSVLVTSYTSLLKPEMIVLAAPDCCVIMRRRQLVLPLLSFMLHGYCFVFAVWLQSIVFCQRSL